MILTLAVSLLLSLDGGVAAEKPLRPAEPATAAGDLEVIRNLELLENLPSTSELDMLQELSIER